MFSSEYYVQLSRDVYGSEVQLLEKKKQSHTLTAVFKQDKT